jgi:hypothetical protein
MKNRIRITLYSLSLALVGTIVISACITGCKVPEAIANKSGAQLWGENCNRCHNAPDPRTYSDDQWDAACEHMRQKAILTNTEINKIKDFLKSAN